MIGRRLSSIVLAATAAIMARADVVSVEYQLADLGSGRWEYTYDVSNVSLFTPIAEFTIWFDFDRYADLVIETDDPPASEWDELVVQPEPLLQDDGFYDALTLSTGIDVGQHVGGFAVSFDWLDAGAPGSQRFDVIDPATFETLYSGVTTPEPTSGALGLLCLAIKRRRKPIKQQE